MPTRSWTESGFWTPVDDGVTNGTTVSFQLWGAGGHGGPSDGIEPGGGGGGGECVTLNFLVTDNTLTHFVSVDGASGESFTYLEESGVGYVAIANSGLNGGQGLPGTGGTGGTGLTTENGGTGGGVGEGGGGGGGGGAGPDAVGGIGGDGGATTGGTGGTSGGSNGGDGGNGGSVGGSGSNAAIYGGGGGGSGAAGTAGLGSNGYVWASWEIAEDGADNRGSWMSFFAMLVSGMMCSVRFLFSA